MATAAEAMDVLNSENDDSDIEVIQATKQTGSLSSGTKTDEREEASVAICDSFFTASLQEFQERNPNKGAAVNDLISAALQKCQSKDFLAFVRSAGLVEPTFEASPYLSSSSGSITRKTRFVDACKTLPSIASLMVVFHGTPEDNVPAILQHGLDPSKRSRQVCGAGEYFSIDPGTSTAYSGNQMLVFLVVRPMKTTQKIQGQPLDFVIVEDNDHQLPLGVLSCTAVRNAVLQRSREIRQRLLKLHQEAQLAEEESKRAQIKSKIIQKLIQEELEVAIELYQKDHSYLTDTNKREIAKYVHLKIDEDMIAYYFPDLPQSMTREEENTIVRLEDLEKDSDRKKQVLDREKTAVASDSPVPLISSEQSASRPNVKSHNCCLLQ